MTPSPAPALTPEALARIREDAAFGAAWRRAEAALPDGWCDLMVYHFDTEPGDHHEPGHYGAKTIEPYPRLKELGGYGCLAPVEIYGYGATPAEALDALAAQLEAR